MEPLDLENLILNFVRKNLYSEVTIDDIVKHVSAEAGERARTTTRRMVLEGTLNLTRSWGVSMPPPKASEDPSAKGSS